MNPFNARARINVAVSFKSVNEPLVHDYIYN